MLVVNNFTAKANSIIPNTFLIILIPDFPNNLPINLDDFNIMQTNKIFIKIAIMMFVI